MSPTSHPEFEDLLLWQTGELSPTETEVVRKHLQRCRECRQKVDELDALNAETEWVSSRVAQRRMSVRVHEMDRSRWTNLLPALARKLTLERPWMAATASIVIIALLLVSFTDLTPSARADTLLKRASRQEDNAEFHPHLLRVESGNTQCQMNMEHVGAQRLLVASESDFCESVSMRFHTLGWDWNNLLSAKSFEQWRASLKEKRDSIRKLSDATELSTSTGEGPIRKATLRLRATDYHPVSASFQFADGLPQSEIEVAEMPLAPPVPETVSVRDSPGPSVPDHLALLPNPLDQTEADVRLALHHAGMDDNVLIAVERQDSGVRVWGVAPDERVRNSIAEALKAIPDVKLAILTDAEEQASQAPLPWQAAHGVALPLASEQLDTLFAGNPEGRQAFQNDLDTMTLRLVGEARTRDALLALARRGPSAPYAAEVSETAASLGFKMVADQKLLHQRLQPLIGSSNMGESSTSHGRPLTYPQAAQVYAMVHDVVLASKGEASSSLDQETASLHKLLSHP